MKKSPPFHNPFARLKDLAVAEKRKETAAIKKSTNIKAPQDQAKTPLSPEEDHLTFLRAVADVKPLGNHETQQKYRAKLKETEEKNSRAADTDAYLEFISGSHFAQFTCQETDPEAVNGYAQGVNSQTVDALRQGEFGIDDRLDLHGCTVVEAKKQLNLTISNLAKHGARCLLVICGKGQNSPGGVATLQKELPGLLTEPPMGRQVLAFSMALPKDGGSGAFYVLIRKLGIQKMGS